MSSGITTSATPRPALTSSLSVQLLGVLWLCALLTPLASVAAPAWLSPTEQAWLKEHPEIRLAPTPDFSPIEFFDKDGAYRGLAADYMADVEQMLGIRFKIIRQDSWPAVLNLIQQRQADLVAAAAITRQRENYLAFTQPYLELPAVIITRAGDIDRTHMKALAGHRVAVVAGYALHDWLRTEYPEITVVPVPTVEAGLRHVAYGQADAIIEANAVALYYIERAGLTNLHVAGDSGFVWRLAAGVRSDWAILRNILQKALDRIPATRRTELMQNWVKLNHFGWSPCRGLLLGLASGLALLLVLAVFSWNRALKRQVQARTQTLEEKLREIAAVKQTAYLKDKTFNQLFTAVDVPLALHELNGDLIQLNDQALDLFGLQGVDLDQVRFPRDFLPVDTDFKRLTLIWERVVQGQTEHFHWLACHPRNKALLHFWVCCRRISLQDRDAVLSCLQYQNPSVGSSG